MPAMGEGFFPHFVRRNSADMAACVRRKKACSNLGAGKFLSLAPSVEVLYLHFPASSFRFNTMNHLEPD